MADRHIIEMKGEPGDQGEILYTPAPPRPRGPRKNWFAQVFGIALGFGVFLALIFFFVYVILPLIAILILWGILRNMFRPRRS